MPVTGPLPNTPEWYEFRQRIVGASECAAVCGVSGEKQALDVYLEKVGIVQPFEGNEYTRRGKRFERFLAEEYTSQTGIELETDLPLFYLQDRPFIGATPDARHASDHNHLVELKCCNFRRAAKLGEEFSDDIFEDWLLQAQQQMLVMDAGICEFFVMVDLHTYRRYTVTRSDKLINQITEQLSEFWDHVERRIPPDPDWSDPERARSLVESLFAGLGEVESVPMKLSEDVWELWVESQQLKEEIKALSDRRIECTGRIYQSLGRHAIGRSPDGQRELVRKQIPDSIVTATDVAELQQKVGKVKRRGYQKLFERAVQEVP